MLCFFDKYTMTSIHEYNIIWISFIALMFYALSIHHSSNSVIFNYKHLEAT